MACVTYIAADGAESVIDVPDGDNVMHGALYNGVEGIVGECGGALACATCHCYVDAAWADQLPAPSQDEIDMLASASAERRPTSRLSCQIIAAPALDGMIIRLPDSQY